MKNKELIDKRDKNIGRKPRDNSRHQGPCCRHQIHRVNPESHGDLSVLQALRQ